MSLIRTGKVPPKILEKFVFPFLGGADTDVIHGPGLGRDAALVRVGQRIVVATTDPITGAVEKIGAYVLHICANDVATFGIQPRWFLATILLPENSKPNFLQEIMVSMHSAAQSLNVSIIGGHTEVTPDLTRPIVIGFMLGIAEGEQFVTSANAKAGNILILTKGLAIEGTAILATERAKDLSKHLSSSLLTRAQQFIDKLSVVPEALEAMKTNAVTAMHDPTEGGVANGLHELADASGVGFIINRDALIIHEETRLICDTLDIDPLTLIASGAMIMAVKEDKAHNVISALRENNISATIIGQLVADSSVRLLKEPDGSETPLVSPEEDALWQALKKRLE